MFFTRVGRIIAYLALVLGVLRTAMGFVGASTSDYQAFAQRYLGTETTGEAINQGMIMILIAVVVGVLTDISRSVER